MPRNPHFTKRATAAALTLAASVAVTAVALTVAATPSQAATCNGYVGLTYDDGPMAGNTTNLLNTLKANGARATMFNIGQNAQQNQSLVQAEKAANMWIGNHSWTHPHMTTLSTAQMTSEISQTQQILTQVTGTAPKLFRPPFGETNATLKSVEAQFGLTEIIWDIDSQDWNGASTAQIVQAAGRLTNGQIILMHDFPPNTIAAIPQIMSGLTSRNLCPGMISPSTGRAVAPDGNPSTPQSSSPASSPSRSQSASASATTGTSNPPGTSCRVTSAISAWDTGLVNNMTIANTGTTTFTNWTMTMTLAGGQVITSGWNATYSPTSGQVTVTNAGHNATIPPGGSAAIGYQANHTGNSSAPTGISLGGTRCT
jgi:peptidoglycan/xylan/chitin deacetylase (PgdA/CDA1 family)